MSQSSGNDWRELLYLTALSHMQKGPGQRLDLAIREFSFLSSYRDSRELMDSCRQEYDVLVRKALHTRNTHTALKYARILQFYTDQDLAPALKERRDKLQKNSLFRRKLKKGIAAGMAVLLAAAIAVFFIWLFSSHHPALLAETQTLIQEQDYEGALDNCRHLLTGPYAQEAEKLIPLLYHSLGIQKREAKEYEQAVAAFQAIEEEEELQTTHLLWAQDLAEQGFWEDACDHIKRTGENVDIQAYLKTWALDALEQEDFAQASTLIRNMEDDDETESLSARLREERLSAAIRSVFPEEGEHPSGDISQQIDLKLAYEKGSQLDDLASALTFCLMLQEHGIDSGALFPDGIVISDLSLSDYQFCNEHQELSVPDTPKVLVFSRKVKESFNIIKSSFITDTEPNPVFNTTLSWITEPFLPVQILFLPEETFSLSENFWPSSWEECNLLLISDTIYHICGSARINYRMNRKTTYSSFSPIYEAVDNATWYSREDPAHAAIMDYQENKPNAYENSRDISGNVVVSSSSTDGLWGVSDPDFLEQALEKGLSVFENNGE